MTGLGIETWSFGTFRCVVWKTKMGMRLNAFPSASYAVQVPPVKQSDTRLMKPEVLTAGISSLSANASPMEASAMISAYSTTWAPSSSRRKEATWDWNLVIWNFQVSLG